MPPIIVRVATPQQPRPVIVTPSRQIPAAPSPPRRQRSLHVKLNPQPRPPGPFFMNITVMVDPPPRPPQRIIVNYADSRHQPSPVQPSPVQVSPPQVVRTIDISPAASPVVVHPDLPVPGVISRSNGSLRRKESARSRTGGLPVVVEMDRPGSQSGIAISPEVVMLERPRSWVPPPPPLVERVDPGLVVAFVLAGFLSDCGSARRSTNHLITLVRVDWSTSPSVSFTLPNSLSVTMQEAGPSALGLIANQLVINIGPDPRLLPPPAESGRPVFIRFGPSPPPSLTRSQPKVPTIPVTVRVTAPKRARQRQRPPPTPIDVPIPMVPEISPGTIPKTGADLLTPHPTVIPSPFMRTVITSETSRTPKPTIIKLPNFNSPLQRDGIDPPRAPAFVRATARMPHPARPDKERTVIRVPDKPPPTPIIVRIQSPLGSPRIAQQSLPGGSVTLHVRAPEPSIRSPSRVFARLKNEGSVGNDAESNTG